MLRNLSSASLLLTLLLVHESAQTTEVRLGNRAKRCICISITCGCYQPSGSVVRPSPTVYRQPAYQSNVPESCVSSCMRSCLQTQYSSCQRACQNSCGVQSTYQPPRYSYQYEPPNYEVPTGQQTASGACINICMPSCESQCIQQSTPVPVVQQYSTPVPVVQQQPSQVPFYYQPQQYEPTSAVSTQYYPDGTAGNKICISLCMPSCESQCTERPGALPYSGQSVPDYQTATTSYPSSPYQPSPIRPTQTPIIIRPQQSTTICIPICMPACNSQCTERSGQGQGVEYSTMGPMSTQTELPPHEISINLPQSIQHSTNCLNLCQETCMQQCIAQNQPADQCRPSCSYTCQESCAHAPTTSQSSSEIYETTGQNLPTSFPASEMTNFANQTPLRSPPYFEQQQQEVIGCQSSSAGSGQCSCPSGYVICLSTVPHTGQQCCRRRR